MFSVGCRTKPVPAEDPGCRTKPVPAEDPGCNPAPHRLTRPPRLFRQSPWPNPGRGQEPVCRSKAADGRPTLWPRTRAPRRQRAATLDRSGSVLVGTGAVAGSRSANQRLNRHGAADQPPCQEVGTPGRPEVGDVGAGNRCDQARWRCTPMTDKVRDVRLIGAPAANLPGTPTLDLCQEAGTGGSAQVPTPRARDNRRVVQVRCLEPGRSLPAGVGDRCAAGDGSRERRPVVHAEHGRTIDGGEHVGDRPTLSPAGRRSAPCHRRGHPVCCVDGRWFSISADCGDAARPGATEPNHRPGRADRGSTVVRRAVAGRSALNASRIRCRWRRQAFGAIARVACAMRACDQVTKARSSGVMSGRSVP